MSSMDSVTGAESPTPARTRAASQARGWVGLIAAGAVIQLAWFPAAPLWTILTVALSVVVVYELTAHWDE